MCGGLRDNTTARCAALSALLARSCRGGQTSSRLPGGEGNQESGQHAIRGSGCTPRCPTMFVAGSASALSRVGESRRDGEIYAEFNALMSPAMMTLRNLTPDKIGLQIMSLMRSSAQGARPVQVLRRAQEQWFAIAKEALAKIGGCSRSSARLRAIRPAAGKRRGGKGQTQARCTWSLTAIMHGAPPEAPKAGPI